MSNRLEQLKGTLDQAAAREQPLRRGAGMQLSHERTNAQSHERINADTHDRTFASNQESTEIQAETEPERVNRGYRLREDLIRECRMLAIQERRKLYEVMEQALEEYLERHRRTSAAK